VETGDSALDALVNTWLPYEAYTGWIKQHVETGALDPANEIMRYTPIGANAAYLFRQALINFAGRLSVAGTYHTDEFSQTDLSADDLLSLAICTASYVAETGNIGVLSQTVAFKDGLVMSLGEHCERAIRKCANGNLKLGQDHEALEQALRLWSFIRPNDEFTSLLEKIVSRKPLDQEELPEERSLPRRIRYLQSICPTLAQMTGPSQLNNGTADAKTMLAVYSLLVEDVFGITATYEGLSLKPNLPESWFECMVTRRFRGDTYNIHIKRSATKSKKGMSVIIDGEPVLGDMLPFFADGCEHEVEVNVG
jgi:cellobiose phosphorylase